jgi:microcystin-dependent protein
MAEPFLSEIRIFSFDFPPKGWAFCNGQLLPINQNQALFALLGTTYGGNGQTNFALPNLQARVGVHRDQQFTLGQRGGEEAHTLTPSELPQHTHVVRASKQAALAGPPGTIPDITKILAQGTALQQGGASVPAQIYGSGAPNRSMLPATISNAGGSQPHTNMHPYLTLNFCIALQGIFPSQN